MENRHIIETLKYWMKNLDFLQRVLSLCKLKEWKPSMTIKKKRVRKKICQCIEQIFFCHSPPQNVIKVFDLCHWYLILILLFKFVVQTHHISSLGELSYLFLASLLDYSNFLLHSRNYSHTKEIMTCSCILSDEYPLTLISTIICWLPCLLFVAGLTEFLK